MFVRYGSQLVMVGQSRVTRTISRLRHRLNLIQYHQSFGYNRTTTSNRFLALSGGTAKSVKSYMQ
jgi:hypothetical protein